jgi:BTB/POZ domain
MIMDASNLVFPKDLVEKYIEADILPNHARFSRSHVDTVKKAIIEIWKICLPCIKENAKNGYFEVDVKHKFFGTNNSVELICQVLNENFELQIWMKQFGNMGMSNTLGTVFKSEILFQLTFRWGADNPYFGTNPTPPSSLSAYKCSAAEYLDDLFNAAIDKHDGTDMIFEAGDCKFTVHSQIVKLQSLYFKKKLDSDNGSEEAISKEIKISEYSPGIVKLFLEFIYKGNLPKDRFSGLQKETHCLNAVANLLSLAKTYQVTKLIQWCECEIEFRIKEIKISPENAIELCKFASASFEVFKSLQMKCLDYFNQSEEGLKQFAQFLDEMTQEEFADMMGQCKSIPYTEVQGVLLEKGAELFSKKI